MSMLCLIGQISDADLRSLAEMPKRVEQLVNEGKYFEKKQSFWKRIFSKQEKPVYSWMPDPANATCDIDKAWDLLNFVLSGGSDEGEFIVNGGQEIGEDLGYGPVRFFNHHETAAIADTVAALTVQEVKARLLLPELTEAELYPVYGEPLTEEDRSWIVEEFIRLKDFLQQTRASGKGLYVYIY